MATLVKFRQAHTNEIIAYFPQLKYNKRIHGNDLNTSYSHVGQHSACSGDYIKCLCRPANESEYLPLKQELESIGYTLKVCK